MNSNELLIEKLDRQEADELLVALSPNSKLGTERIVQCVSVRGIDEKQLKRYHTHLFLLDVFFLYIFLTDHWLLQRIK